MRENDVNRPDGRQAPDLDSKSPANACTSGANAKTRAVPDNECITAFDPGSWGDLGLDALSDEFSFANNMAFDFFI